MEQLDSVARRYGTLPSKVLGIEDELKAMTVNLWAHNYGVRRENERG
jgi:hypothetical protein